MYVSRREKRNIPFIISACVREVERRGIHEVGVYRVSGSASDLNRLKKSFETSEYTCTAGTTLSWSVYVITIIAY